MILYMNTQNEFLQKEESVIRSKMNELEKDLEDVRRLRSKYSTEQINGEAVKNKKSVALAKTDKEIQTHVPVSIPSLYDRDVLTWEQRCIYILNELGSGTVEDVVKKVMEYEPDVTETTAKNVVTNKLSKLNRSGKITADMTGKKYIYSL